MRGVDLQRTRFDFDLTFAVMLMHPDGTVYHRYGSRDVRGVDVWLSLESFERVLEETLVDHAAYVQAPSPVGREPELPLEAVPSFAKRDKGECIHCHSVFPAFYEEMLSGGDWDEDDRWVYPPPGRVGLDLDRDDQSLVRAVAAGSAAALAGLEPGDHLLSSGSQRLVTASDLAWVLNEAPPEGGELAFEVERDGEPRTVALELAPGWKRGTPLEFSWRPFKWGFTPAPGFGGPLLSPGEREALGLDREAFAFRISYFVTWNENRRYGLEAIRAGLREDDVVVSVGGRADFASVDHFHSWWRLTRSPGDRVTLEVLRAEERQTITLEVLP
jgi:hypothetical protein